MGVVDEIDDVFPPLEEGRIGVVRQERLLGAGSINRLSGEDFHRIVLPHRQQAWTFFMHSGKVRDWGFLTSDENDAEVYTPHEQVNNEGSHDHWWKAATRGRHAAREPLEIDVS